MVTPSVLVIPRSACGVSVSVSVALLSAVLGSMARVTVAVLTSEPVAAAEMVQLAT